MPLRPIAPLMAAIAVLLTPATPSLAQNQPYGAPITVEQAKRVAQAASVEMRKRNLQMTIAIVDSGSNLVYLERADQAGIGTIDAAIGKAKAANGIKSPTKAIGDLIVNQNQINLLGVTGAFPVEGGVPLIVDNKVIGAIGASGGMLPDDGAVANAGAKGLQ
ncbi:heme-binding protein [Asticcacaulis sp. SL142]|uniref:GlcG/HbpS family heme-binding protein n=1 Tax=Asticcacaulis sp. SL142 TaxID=2995155 RepID=UPI00226D039D|nr:heme-binding protein [Asticcacaulis sp. SL142]WAC48234.1 heme-binding protein [Asticcacaulis sp. SL142]